MFPRVVQYGDGRDAATATAAPSEVASPAESDRVTRTHTGTSDSPAEHEIALRRPAASSSADDRLPAPLQYRDPARYEIVAEHGRGGLGRVFRARDKELGRDVALKELLSRGSTTELRFFREALITARLEHPGIVPVHEAGRWPDGTPFYAMKLVAGRPLKALIDECKTLEDRLALLPHVIAVADAIAYAHDRKIIHRDLKPSNIIVGDFGETVVIDWGLAKDISDQAPADDPIPDGPYRTAAPAAGDGVTVAGSIVGTPAYMSPEQARGEPVDERTDVYALGRILFDVLGRSAPAELRALCSRATQGEKGARYSSARALADDLRNFTKRLPVAAHRYSFSERVSRWGARNRPVLVASAIAVLVLLIASTIGVFALIEKEQAASRSRALAEDRVDSLILAQAKEWLARDPRESLLWLSKYSGRSGRWQEAASLASDAVSRGYSSHALPGHLGRVTSLASSPNGSALVSTSTDGAGVLWRVHGRQIDAHSHCRGFTEDAATSVDVGHALAASTDGSGVVAICDLHAGTQWNVPMAFSPVHLIFDAKGEALLSIGGAGEIALVQLSTRSIVWQTASPSPISVASFVTSDMLLLGDADHVALVEAKTGSTIARHAADHGALVAADSGTSVTGLLTARGCWTTIPHARPSEPLVWRCVAADGNSTMTAALALTGMSGVLAVSRDDRLLAMSIGENSGLIHLDSGRLEPIALAGDVRWLGFDPTSQRLYAAHMSGEISWRVIDGGSTGRFVGHDKFVLLGGFVKIGDDWRLVTAGADSIIRVWSSPELGGRVRQISERAIYDILATGSGALIVDGQDGQVRTIGGTEVVSLGGDESIARGLARGGDLVASAHWSGTVRLWRAGLNAGTFEAPGSVRTVAVSPDASSVAAGSADGSLTIWSASRRDITSHRIHSEPITAVVFADSQRIVTSSMDGRLVAFEVDSSTQTVLWRSEAPIEALAVDRSTEQLVAGDRKGVISLVSTRGGFRRQWSLPVSDWVSSISISDGVIVAGTRAGVVAIVQDAAVLPLVTRLMGHTGMIREVVRLPGGRFATSSQDSTVRIWEALTGRSFVLRADPRDVLEGIEVSADENSIQAVGWLGRVYTWSLPPKGSGAPADQTLKEWIAERVVPSDAPDSFAFHIPRRAK